MSCDKEQKSSWRLLPIKGSLDISFCSSEDCKTLCRRNRNLQHFKDMIERMQAGLGDSGFYSVSDSVSDFVNRCRDYEKEG